MLVITRQRGESIIIGENIIVKIVDIRGDKARLSIEAPAEVSVLRREVYEAIQREKMTKGFTGEVLSCPFCGELDKLQFQQINVGPLVVLCPCGAQGPFGKGPKQAIQGWNRIEPRRSNTKILQEI